MTLLLIEGDTRSTTAILIDPAYVRSSQLFRYMKRWRINFVVGENFTYGVEFSTKKAALQALKLVRDKANAWGFLNWMRLYRADRRS